MDNVYFIVYKITNQINGKIYIGVHKTKDLNDNYIGSGKYLNHSIKKHGIENFKKEILFIYDNPKEMFDKEKELVNIEFLSEENTYNLKVGGMGGFDYINKSGKNLYEGIGGKTTGQQNFIRGNELKKIMKERGTWEAYRKNVSDSLKNKFKNGMLNGFKGKSHSEETKMKIREANKGKQEGSKNSQFGSMWITDGEISKKIKKTDSIPDGFRKGRKLGV